MENDDNEEEGAIDDCLTNMRVGMHSWCAPQVYFWPMEVKFGPRGSQVMKKKKIFK